MYLVQGNIVVGVRLEIPVRIHVPGPGLVVVFLVEKLYSGCEISDELFLIRESDFIQKRRIVIRIKLIDSC
jgi:hypothetical protein